MTGAQTDPISTSIYLRAASRTLALAHPLFKLGMPVATAEDTPYQRQAFNHWYVLRHIVDTFLRNGCTRLDNTTREHMVGALRFAHEHAHDLDMPGTEVPPVSECKCATAEMIAEVTVMCHDPQGVPCA